MPNKRRRPIYESGNGSTRRVASQHQRSGHTAVHQQSNTSTVAQRGHSANASQPRTQDGPAVLPGYYYDPDKKKYFAIAKNNQASTGAVTKDFVARQHEASLATRRNESKRLRDSRRFQRCHIFGQTVVAALFRSEMGADLSRSALTDTVRRMCTARLCGSVNRNSRPRIWFNADAFVARPGSRSIAFHYDTQRRILVFALVDFLAGATSCTRGAFVVAMDQNPFAHQANPQAERFLNEITRPRGFASRILALRCLLYDKVRECHDYAAFRPLIAAAPESQYLISFPNECLVAVSSCLRTGRASQSRPRDDVLRTVHRWAQNFSSLSTIPNHVPAMISAVDVACHFSVRKGPHDFDFPGLVCAAVQPHAMQADSSPLMLKHISGNETSQAICIELLDKNAHTTTIVEVHSAITAVAFAGPTTWIYGLRNGLICTANSTSRNWKSDVHVLGDHGGRVTHLHVLSNSMYLIANGFSNNMCLYRLKKNKSFAQMGTQRTSSWRPGSELEVMVRYDHHNSRYPSNELGFAVYESLELVAVAQDDGSILVFSIFSGVTLVRLSIDEPLRSISCEAPRIVSTIQIVPDDHGYCRILAAREGIIYDFAEFYD